MSSWQKVAVSSLRALGALQARQQLGSRVGPQAMHMFESMPPSGSTPSSLRKAVLAAKDDAQMAQRAQAFASQPQPTAARARSSEVIGLEQTDPRRMYDFRGPETRKTDNYYLASPEKKEMLFGGGSSLADPSGLITKAPAAAHPTAPTALADTVPSTPPAMAGTAVGRRPRRKIAAAEYNDPMTWVSNIPLVQSTGDSGRTRGRTNENPADAARSGFWSIDHVQDRVVADSPQPVPIDKTAGYTLAYRTKFRGLDISIENRKGSYRYWYDKGADKEGKTLMKYPYGYVRRSKGLDGDHVDVFLGPNHAADNVYVVMTNKAPDFDKPDEEKCFLGFDSEEDARAAFAAHYDKPEFFRSISTISFDTFKKRIGETFDGVRKKVAASVASLPDSSDPKHMFVPHGGPVDDLVRVLGVQEKPLGFPPSGPMRKNIVSPMTQEDTIDRQFDYFDKNTNSSAIEGLGEQPAGGPLV